MNTWALPTFLFLFTLLPNAVHAEGLTQENFLKVKNSTFEFVRPLGIEAPNIVYNKPITYENLPHYLKKDKLLSFGTAFAIDPKHIITAAHVLNLHQQAVFIKDIRLRDQDGKTHEIDEIKKYSQLEDYAVFTLKTYPKNMTFLKFAKKPEIGSAVYAVGNALGQGIVERLGRVTSYTDEEIEGQWKFIRFTAPASPGNSGGPLVNQDGNVVGLVVRKSNDENLNYAVPIELIENNSGKVALFHDRNLVEGESNERLFTPWKYSMPLPQKLLSFAASATAAFVSGIKERRTEFEKQFKDKIFPNDKGIEPYLRYQEPRFSFVKAEKNTNGLWSNAFFTDFGESNISEDQVLISKFTETNILKIDGEFYLNKPKKETLLSFVNTPKNYFDVFLKAASYFISLGEERFTITSLGEPYKTSKWTDNYGRNWISAYWAVSPLNTFISTHCLPTPIGVACYIKSAPSWADSFMEFYQKKEAARQILSYYGKIDEWQEFLKLPGNMKPKSLQGLIIDQKNSTIDHQKLFGLKLKIPQPLTKESTLEINLKHALDLKSEELSSIALEPTEKKSFFFGTKRIYDAIASSTEEAKKDKKEIFQKISPYDGHLQEDNESYYYKFISNDSKPLPKVNSVIINHCSSSKDKDKSAVEQTCLEFKKIMGL